VSRRNEGDESERTGSAVGSVHEALLARRAFISFPSETSEERCRHTAIPAMPPMSVAGLRGSKSPIQRQKTPCMKHKNPYQSVGVEVLVNFRSGIEG
jgi:hypothetical protein